MTPPFTLEVTATPSPDDIAVLGDGLGAYNATDVGPSGREGLAVLLRQQDTVTGGIAGFTAWGWLYVQWLFVPEALRGQGVAARLLAAAEKEAVTRGCHGAWIDTFNPTALRAYQKQGFAIFGALDDFPEGRTRWFLQKRLVG